MMIIQVGPFPSSSIEIVKLQIKIEKETANIIGSALNLLGQEARVKNNIFRTWLQQGSLHFSWPHLESSGVISPEVEAFRKICKLLSSLKTVITKSPLNVCPNRCSTQF